MTAELRLIAGDLGRYWGRREQVLVDYCAALRRRQRELQERVRGRR